MPEIMSANQLVGLRPNAGSDQRPTLLKPQMNLDIPEGEFIAIVRSDVLLEKVEEILERLQKNAPQCDDGFPLMHLTQIPIEEGGDAGSTDVRPYITAKVSQGGWTLLATASAPMKASRLPSNREAKGS